MIEQLFGSKTRVKLLQLFYKNPNRSFYVREITRKIDEQINSVRRELANLLTIGIISSETTNNRLYYEVNQKYEHYGALSAIFGEGKSAVSQKVKVTDNQVHDINSLGNVGLAVYTGQFTRDESSGIDILIVGDVNKTKISKYIADLEKKEGRDMRYTLMSPDEFKYRQQVKDRFISLVLSSKIQVLVDKGNLINRTQKSTNKKEK